MNLRQPPEQYYFVIQINEALSIPFIHFKLKNKAVSLIPIKVYIPLDMNQEDNMIDLTLK